MMKSGIDQEALVQKFSEATAKQGETLRKAVSDATLKALQGRELTVQNIRGVLKTITQAATTGLAKNTAQPVELEAMLGKALAGMDAALLKTVEANRKALQQFVDQGVNLREGQLKEAVDNLEKMEDVFFSTVSKAANATGGPLQAQWDKVLKTMKVNGSETGNKATDAVQALMTQTQDALRQNRAMGMRTAQAMMNSYSTLVSGVLIGMSEALQQGGTVEGVASTSETPPAAAPAAARAARKPAA